MTARFLFLDEVDAYPGDVAGDGGDIVFRGFRDGVVKLLMQGACSGCPSSRATLKHGVDKMLRHSVPEVLSVEQVEA
jgi:Fe-S cluster biogenesis protein NfuA